MKTVYQTDLAGMYRGDTVADESPMEPGVYLMPAGTVDVPPPATWPDDKWPRFNGTRWDLIARPTLPENSPTQKLAEFLAANPDVAALIGTSQGGV